MFYLVAVSLKLCRGVYGFSYIYFLVYFGEYVWGSREPVAALWRRYCGLFDIIVLSSDLSCGGGLAISGRVASISSVSSSKASSLSDPALSGSSPYILSISSGCFSIYSWSWSISHGLSVCSSSSKSFSSDIGNFLMLVIIDLTYSRLFRNTD